MKSQYRIGAGKAEIIITSDMFPYGYGRGPGFTGIHDPLYIRALIVENDTDRVLIITADLDSFGHIEMWKDKICGVIDVERDHIFVMHTHNHESIHVRNDKDDKPEGDEDTARSERLVWDAMQRAIATALKKLQPGKICFGTGTCDVNINREFQYLGYYMIGRNPQGPSDKTVAVFRFTDMNDKPLAFFINYAVHGSVMAEMESDEILITGDLPGYTSRFVEERYNDEVVALWTSGAAGNQDAKYRATRYAFDANGVLYRYNVGEQGFALCDMQARDLAEEVIRVATEVMGEGQAEGELRSIQTVCNVPGKMKKGQGRPDFKNMPPPDMSVVRPEGMMMKDVDINHANGAPVDVQVGLIVLGDTVLACYSGEETYTLGKMAQRALAEKFKNVVIVAHTNGYIGYMSEESGFDRRVRSALVSLLARGGAEKVVVETPVKLAEALGY